MFVRILGAALLAGGLIFFLLAAYIKPDFPEKEIICLLLGGIGATLVAVAIAAVEIVAALRKGDHGEDEA